ncbi:lipid IV(A) palmitoyltransferase PagP [Rahnella sp. C60]|uniref:Lipid A acyltransferase PagP n=3 Tax=Rahnella perminowiae TaxID=2816244 RepID=A0ABS6L8A7_9GAMM|nr:MULTISPECIES: lipid IV(A) palmitoyltransferase PagP [Rahnella]MBU9816076.1 lipid IV(A) palmitoyltransferase PagP [Rahnella perminowiae]MBU9837948.1 lipid IV(A) palmitoyltransferase PagP [Rahnella perminowiae]UJD90605.1 phospholipid:lipid A palmitoyltransferase [Rahnella aquatilis]
MFYKKITRDLSFTVVLACCVPAFAANNSAYPTDDPKPSQKESIFPGIWSDFKDKVSTTWNDSDSQDLYLPVITWHNRLTYDKEKTDKYNERPWGGGYGISRYDEKGNWNGIYLMAFKDSHNKWEPIGGYGWEKIWTPAEDKNFRLGLGYTAAVTARDDYKYIPIPIVLPLASIGYNKLTFQATYIPGTYNNGNVFFAWLRYQF